jgi:ribosome maturation factor RimP
MIDKAIIEDIVNQQINSDIEFVVDITISVNNKIMVVIDSDSGITIDRCVSISKAIEQQIDRDKEDFELEVASAGLSEPLRIVRQYTKNIGREVEVLMLSGEKFKGKLFAASAEGFSIEVQAKELVEGKKRKQLVTKTLSLAYGDVKSTKIVISFR